MTELIQKLAEDAGLDARTMGVSHTEQWNASVSKLTQLIVAECVQTLNTEIDRLCEYKNSLAEYSNHSKREDVDLVVEKCHDNIQMIKEHFGVDE
jgi:hypothetical protein